MPRIAAEDARHVVRSLLDASGLVPEHAGAMTDVLIQTELMGHRTHGLAMLPTYLDRLANGMISREGNIEVVSETQSTLAWQAHRLPGAYVVKRAREALYRKLEDAPVVTATIANCSHIGSLQTYLLEPAEQGLLGLMMVTDPGVASVAPFGGAEPVLTSNPVAVGIPTEGDPILIDQCTSLVSNAQVQSIPEGQAELPGEWLVDNQGRPSRDPKVLKTDPPGTIMPLGGAEFGYKGFGFMLMCEAFGLALSGHGRNTPKPRGAQGVFLQLIEPSAFSGRAEFLAETTDLARRCTESRPAAGGAGVRLPGQRAIAELRRQTGEGLSVDDGVWGEIEDYCERLGVPTSGSSPAAGKVPGGDVHA